MSGAAVLLGMAPMKQRLAVLAIAGAVLAGTALGQEVRNHGLTIARPWARASAGPARNAVGYMTIGNAGAVDDRLVAVSAGISERAGLHTHIMDGEVMRMRPVDAIDVPAGSTVRLEPGGLHIMFVGLARPLEEGERFAATLSFERSGAVVVEFAVMGVGAMSPD
jgi:copper(I)-binding protein